MVVLNSFNKQKTYLYLLAPPNTGIVYVAEIHFTKYNDAFTMLIYIMFSDDLPTQSIISHWLDLVLPQSPDVLTQFHVSQIHK